jgi:hypothetical protein
LEVKDRTGCSTTSRANSKVSISDLKGPATQIDPIFPPRHATPSHIFLRGTFFYATFFHVCPDISSTSDFLGHVTIFLEELKVMFLCAGNFLLHFLKNVAF